MINFDYMKQIAAEEGFIIDKSTLNMLDKYAETLVEWNKRINLTAITDPNEIAIKHFLDSFLLLKSFSIPNGAAMIDVGTGAGFPSVPCKILRNDLNLTLLDSLNKRILFLQELISVLGIEADCIHARAEETGQDKLFREKYDIATARAVAHLRDLSEYCLPFVKKGGIFAALKGYEIEDELAQAFPAIKILGGKVLRVDKYRLPGGSKRAVVVIEKISHTPTKYPRSTAKIKKQPLKY